MVVGSLMEKHPEQKGFSMKRTFLISFILLPFLLGGCQLIDSLQPVATTAPSGTVLFSDDFSSNQNNWGSSAGSAGTISFIYDGLDLKVNQANSLIWSVAGKKFKDTTIDIDGVLLSGSENDVYGAICRFQDNDHFYGFLVTHDGYYGIFKMQDGKLVLVGQADGLKYSDAIRQGGVVNHIQAICLADTLQLSVNGKLLSIIQDESYTQGQIGVIAGSYTNPGEELFFDNLQITQP
jgi:hypothetical protein